MPKKTKKEIAEATAEKKRKWKEKLSTVPLDMLQHYLTTYTDTGRRRRSYDRAFFAQSSGEPSHRQLFTDAEKAVEESIARIQAEKDAGTYVPPAASEIPADAKPKRTWSKTQKRIEFEQNYASMTSAERKEYDRMYTPTGRLREKYRTEMLRRAAAGRATAKQRYENTETE